MRGDLAGRIVKGLAAGTIGTMIGGILTAVLKNAGNDELEMPVGIALIVASLAYWAWTKRDEMS